MRFVTHKKQIKVIVTAVLQNKKTWLDGKRVMVKKRRKGSSGEEGSCPDKYKRSIRRHESQKANGSFKERV